MSTRKLGVYTSKEEFLENEVRTLSHHIASMIDTMKVMSMNRQHMLEEIERLKSESKSAVLEEREACAKVCDSLEEQCEKLLVPDEKWPTPSDCAHIIRTRGQA
jgi:hypothetical protein